jgi:hypothetical protein
VRTWKAWKAAGRLAGIAPEPQAEEGEEEE